MKKIVLAASALALGFGFSAMADGGDDAFTSNANVSIAGQNAASESFNSSASATSVQSLSAATVGVALDLSLLDVPILAGNAANTGANQQNASGVVSASANTGMSAISQQAASIAAVGTVNVGN